MADVFDELAARFRDVARHHARTERRQLERWRVLSLAPLTAGNPDGDIIAADTDPDFHIASRVREYDAVTGIAIDDVLLVLHHDDHEWTVMDVEAAS